MYGSVTKAQGPVQKKPNVLLIVSDDLNIHLCCYGHGNVESPNIDRLARRGVRFEHAFCQYPVCNPNRVSFLSGKYPATTGVLDNDTVPRVRIRDLWTLPQHLRANGYRTRGIGKVFHIADPPSWDDRAQPVLTWKPRGPRLWFEEPSAEQVERLRAFMTPTVVDGNGQDLRDYRSASDAIAALHELKAERSPFFLAVGFHLPHVPFVAPKRYYERYRADQITLPKDFAPAPGWQNVPADAFRPAVDLFVDRPATAEKARELIAAYYACTSFMDAQVGRLLDELDRLDLTKNTIVVFVSDNGWHLGEKGMWAKMTLFEQSAQVPLIIADPRLAATGSVCRRVVEMVDIYPTLVELCGLAMPPGLQGASMAPMLDNSNVRWEKPALTVLVRHRRLARSLRTDRWRYTEWDYGERGVELYDHKNDPLELTNLTSDHKFGLHLAQMKEALRKREHEICSCQWAGC
jgi:uncharacterized sulfatase